MSTPRTTLVVVGSGVAGLSVALAAAPRPVIVLARAPRGGDSASALAQGGIAAAIGPGDSAAAHARDTLEAGAFLNDAAAVWLLVRHAPAAIGRLQALGVAFDRSGTRLRLGREGGHHADRIVHAGGDASGAVLLAALVRAARAAGHVDCREGCVAESLLLRGGRIAGVRVRDASGSDTVVESPDIVLATGGMGALFAVTTNPPGSEGHGLALGLAAGARARDLEFVQFHPTALAPMGDAATTCQRPLVTEALRGAGARLHDDDGRPVMQGLHPLADLAPRDLVARRVWRESQHGGQVWLDATGIGHDWPSRFPTVYASCVAHGIDPVHQRIPVIAAAHFHMGGLDTDLAGQTSVRGLHAVGEVACNRVHGANRLASNSLLEGLVFGHRLGRRLAQGGDSPIVVGAHAWADPGAAATPEARRALGEWLWSAFGPVRNGVALAAARRRVDDCGDAAGWQGRLARRLLAAALRRRTSLGAHHRSDAARD